jgi:molecular chaperone DnaJ
MKKDYYLILGLTPEATAEEIRSAYRRLASGLQPDLSGFGSEQFLEPQEAYSVLSDPKRRAVYDREAEEMPVRRTALARPAETVIRRRHSAELLTPSQPVGGFEEISLLRSFETFQPSFSEMFDRLWSNFELVTRPKAEQLESLTVDVPLSPRQAFVGGQIRILVPARVICPACRGRGSVGPYECWRCEGNGALTDEYPVTVSYPAGLR